MKRPHHLEKMWYIHAVQLGSSEVGKEFVHESEFMRTQVYGVVEEVGREGHGVCCGSFMKRCKTRM